MLAPHLLGPKGELGLNAGGLEWPARHLGSRPLGLGPLFWPALSLRVVGCDQSVGPMPCFLLLRAGQLTDGVTWHRLAPVSPRLFFVRLRCLPSRLEPYPFVSTHASFRSHLWSLKQSGQRSGILTSDSDSNLIFSVVSPVGTAVPSVGQRIIMLGIAGYRRMYR